MRKLQVALPLVIIVFFQIISGCSKPELPAVNESVNYLLPWPNETGQYSLQKVEIKTITNLPEIAGSYATFHMNPRIGDNSISGNNPQVKVIKRQDGTWIPTDVFSSQLLSIYAHIERLADLDNKTGVGGLIPMPMQVGVKVSIYSDDYRTITNNAMYYGKANAFLFVPYVSGDLPISVNGGIIAHEHFHAIYQKIIVDKVIELNTDLSRVLETDSQRLNEFAADRKRSVRSDESDEEMTEEKIKLYTNTMVLKAMNEGLADYWGWLYSNDEDFISTSLPRAGKGRILQKYKPSEVTRMPSLEELKTFVKDSRSQGERDRNSYSIGTQYARLMRSLSVSYQNAERNDKASALFMAQIIVDTLKSIKEEFATKFSREFISGNYFAKNLAKKMKEKGLSTEQCNYLTSFQAIEGNQTQSIDECATPVAPTVNNEKKEEKTK